MDIAPRRELDFRYEVTLKPLRKGSELPQTAGAYLSSLVVRRLDLILAL